MGANRFSGVVGNYLTGQTGLACTRSPQTVSKFPGPGFHLDVVGVDFGSTSVSRLEVVRRPPVGPIFQEDSSGLSCMFVQAGEAIFDDGSGTSLRLGPGSCATFGGESDATIDWGSDCQLLVAKVPRQVARDFGMAPALGFSRIPSDSSLLNSVHGFLDSVVQGSGGISAVGAYFMEKLIHEMIGGLLLEDTAIDTTGNQRPSLYHQAMAMITASAGDAALTPETLAQGLNVSLRHLQRDFQKRNESVADRIRQTRIDLAVRLLTDPTLEVLSLEQIARHAGFSSLGHLRRTLQSAGAGRPRDIRALSQQRQQGIIEHEPELTT